MAKSRLNFGTLYTNGDSWTAGHVIAPKLKKKGVKDCNDKRNDSYRLKYAWPAFTAFRLGVNVVNGAHAGASNDGIVRSTINDINELLKTTPAKDIYAIIGWSSPERKDFFYKNEYGAWDTMYPAELHHWEDDENPVRNDFYKNYVVGYWNEEEYYTRHMLHVITLANFFKAKNIKFKFFNAFYEPKNIVIEKKVGMMDYSSPLYNAIVEYFENDRLKEQAQCGGLLEEYCKIYKTRNIKKTFKQFLLDDCIKSERTPHKVSKFLITHPTKLGHQKWGEYVANILK